MADENRRLKEYVNLLQQQFDAAVNREQQLLSQLTRQSRELEALQVILCEITRTRYFYDHIQ